MDNHRDPTFQVLKEEIGHKRYLTLYHTKVQYEDGRLVDWDTVGTSNSSSGPHFSVIFPYQTQSKRVTVIREYWQGVNAMGWSLPAGAFDRKKHASILDCAVNELREECRLEGGRVVELMQGAPDAGIVELKWSRNRFYAFLAIDPIQIQSHVPPLTDDEEVITIHEMEISDWMALILKGQVALTSVQTTLMALEYLGIRL